MIERTPEHVARLQREEGKAKEQPSWIQFRVPRRKKAAYVRAASRNGSKLADWCQSILDEAASREWDAK